MTNITPEGELNVEKEAKAPLSDLGQYLLYERTRNETILPKPPNDKDGLVNEIFETALTIAKGLGPLSYCNPLILAEEGRKRVVIFRDIQLLIDSPTVLLDVAKARGQEIAWFKKKAKDKSLLPNISYEQSDPRTISNRCRWLRDQLQDEKTSQKFKMAEAYCVVFGLIEEALGDIRADYSSSYLLHVHDDLLTLRTMIEGKKTATLHQTYKRNQTPLSFMSLDRETLLLLGVKCESFPAVITVSDKFRQRLTNLYEGTPDELDLRLATTLLLGIFENGYFSRLRNEADDAYKNFLFLIRSNPWCPTV